MAISQFEAALNQVCDEKGLTKEMVISTVEAALAAAYRKDYGESSQLIRAKLDLDDLTKSKMFQVFIVVKKADLKDEEREMELAKAKKIKKDVKVEDEILIELPQHAEFGRIAAMTAKQVIIQRLQEAERQMIFNEFKEKEGKLINGVIQQIEGSAVIVNLGKINGLLLPNDQIPNEKYFVGQRLKVYVVGVEESARGPRVIVSRSRSEFIKSLFELEVPEITTGSVTIEGIAREAGNRTKMSVLAHQEGLDPVGSCVGQRGIRVQAVLAEIGDEKIDIILFDKDPERYISQALSPAKVGKIKLEKKEKKAKVYVNEDQLSLAIGKNGQNVRLASKLTGWSIDIEKLEVKKDKKDKEKPVTQVTPKEEPKQPKKD